MTEIKKWIGSICEYKGSQYRIISVNQAGTKTILRAGEKQLNAIPFSEIRIKSSVEITESKNQIE